MRYLLKCSCGETLRVSRSQAGTTVACPKCDSRVEVPTIRGLAKLPQEEPSAQSSAPGTAAACKPTWSWQVGLLAGASFLTAIITLSLGGVLLLERIGYRDVLKEIDRWTLQQEIEYGNTMVAAYSNADLFDVWDEYKTVGLGSKEPPKHFIMKNEFDAKRTRMYSLFGVSALAFVGFFAAAILGRRKRQ